jgi:hypothetical protein
MEADSQVRSQYTMRQEPILGLVLGHSRTGCIWVPCPAGRRLVPA